MQRRTVLFLSLAVGIVATLAFVLTAGDEQAPPPSPSSLSPTVPTVLVEPKAVQDPQPVPPGLPRVHVEVFAKERYLPPSPVRVQGVRVVDGSALPTWLLAGAGAGFDASPQAAGVALAAIEHEEGLVLRQAPITFGAVAQVALGTRLVVRGHVVDAQKQPIVGASVWFGEFDADGQRRVVLTVEEGAFEALVLASDGVPFVVSGEGLATQWRVTSIAAPVLPHDAVMERGCVLEVQIAALAVAMEEARVFVVPRPTVATSLARWPFFEQALLDGYPVDANGRAVIPALPMTGEVGLVVRHPRAPLATAQAVTLKGERVRATVPLQFAARSWQGVVTDAAGARLLRAAVWGKAGRVALSPGASQRLVPPHLQAVGTFASCTDTAGAFTIGLAEAPDASLSLRCAGRAGRDLPWSSLVAGQPVVLPEWHGGEVEFRLHPPRAGTPWVAHFDLDAGRDVVAKDQPWRCSLPHAGCYDFVIRTLVGDEERGRTVVEGVHVTGAIELHAPKLP